MLSLFNTAWALPWRLDYFILINRQQFFLECPSQSLPRSCLRSSLWLSPFCTLSDGFFAITILEFLRYWNSFWGRKKVGEDPKTEVAVIWELEVEQNMRASLRFLTWVCFVNFSIVVLTISVFCPSQRLSGLSSLGSNGLGNQLPLAQQCTQAVRKWIQIWHWS